MGRKSREHRERRERCASMLETGLEGVKSGGTEFWFTPDCPPDIRKSHIEDVLAFESVETGTSLFNGLQEHGMELPNPEQLNEQQCAQKAEEIIMACLELQVVLLGFEAMPPRQLYSTLWKYTLWEGCYVKRRNPESFTFIDVSRSVARARRKASTVH